MSALCADPRVFDAMHMAGTYCPYMGAIGEDAKKGWTRRVNETTELALELEGNSG